MTTPTDELAGELGYARVESSPTITFPHWLNPDGSPVCYSDGLHEGEPGAHPIDGTIDGTIDSLLSIFDEHLRPKGWELELRIGAGLAHCEINRKDLCGMLASRRSTIEAVTKAILLALRAQKANP